MSLQLISGSSGSGKSYRLYKSIIEDSLKKPETNYIVVVPEQFTMSTQKELVRLHPKHIISNIDVVSFARLAYRVMEETGRSRVTVLDDIGKSLILRRIAGEKEEELTVLKGNMKRIGYISEIKSAISEFTQYGIDVEDLESLIKNEAKFGSLKYKLEDILTIFRAFKEDIKGRAITSEEVLQVLPGCAGDSHMLKGSVVSFDGFTGFTPVQYSVIRELLKVCSKVLVTVTLDGEYEPGRKPEEHELFKLSKTTIGKLMEIADETGVSVEEIEYIEGNYRLKDTSELAFLEKNIFRYTHETYRGECRNIRVFRALDPRKELEFIAGEISRLIREEGYRYRDISIVTGDVATYSRLAVPIMAECGIPSFMDYKRDVLHNPFIECIRAALAVVNENFSFPAMFRYVKCGMKIIPENDAFLLENYCIARGVKGRSRWGKKWGNYKDSPFAEEEMERINAVREELIAPLDAFAKAFKGNSSVRVKTGALYDFLCAINAQQRLKDMENAFGEAGDADREKEYSQIYKTIIDLLDEYVELLGPEEMSADEYIQILDAGFNEVRIGLIPGGMDMVTLGDITRTRLGDIKVLFFAGVNEGIIPAADAGAGIISQTEREYLSEKISLAPTVREKSYIQRFYLYLNMTKPADRLYISYSALSSDGSGILPSYLISVMTSMFGEDIIKNSRDPIDQIITPGSSLTYLTEHFQEALEGETDMLWRDLYRWYDSDPGKREKLEHLKAAAGYSYNPESDNLGEDLAKRLYGDFLKNSVTRLELYSSCAFAHFLERGLKLSEREEFEISPLEIGNVMHGALEAFTRDMREKGFDWAGLPEDLLATMAEQCVDDTARDMFPELFADSARNGYMVSRLKRLMKRTVWALHKQMGKGDFEQVYAEQVFNYTTKGADGLDVWLRGKIDRMDLYTDGDKVYVKIIDYKTGNYDFDITKFVNGLSLQLGVYLEAAMREMEKAYPGKKAIPAGVFYYNIDDPIVREKPGISDEDLEKELFKAQRMKGLCNDDPDIVRLMDKDIDGASEILPVSVNKDGSIRNTGPAVSTENFAAMRDYMHKLISDMAGRIMSGDARIDPYELKEHTGCEYCAYKSVCGFDPTLDGFETRKCIPGSWDMVRTDKGEVTGDA